jgi:pimeloyl-ACP methyl ester carboxylesterase
MTTLRISIGLVAVLVITAAGFGLHNMNYAERDATRVDRAGFVEKQATINGSRLNYAEGPDNGPPLLLIHGQLTDWRSWSRVLPELSKRYHVFAVDCYGHGLSAHASDFHAGFDHTQTLARISVPTALIHTNWSYDDKGVLLAAMDGNDAERARTLLDDVEFYRVGTGHGFHFEDPDRFDEILRNLEARLPGRAGS